MKRKEDRERILNRLYKISKMGMEASEIILPEIHDKGLWSQIARQDENYINTMEKICNLLKRQGEEPERVSGTAQRMLRSSAKINTFFNKSPQHIAQLMINGSAMGIINMTKTINHSSDGGVEIRKLAESYIANEEHNIDTLKKFL